MTIKERIYSEIDGLDQESLEELYQLIKSFATSKAVNHQPGIMAKLKDVQIDAPSDFSVNLDLYMSGEKRVDPDFH
jgi:diacylglycerol kinase family enzyme